MQKPCTDLPDGLYHVPVVHRVTSKKLEAIGWRFRACPSIGWLHAALPKGWSHNGKPYILVDQTAILDTFRDTSRYVRIEVILSPAGKYSLTVRPFYHISVVADAPSLDSQHANVAVSVYAPGGSQAWRRVQKAFATEVDTMVATLKTQAEAWLNEHHPNWRDPFAYWENLPANPA